MFPQYIDVQIYVEESPYIRGGIINYYLVDENGNGVNSNERINMTIYDEDEHKGSDQLGTWGALYKGCNNKDEHWNKLNDYGNFTVIIQFPEILAIIQQCYKKYYYI